MLGLNQNRPVLYTMTCSTGTVQITGEELKRWYGAASRSAQLDDRRTDRRGGFLLVAADSVAVFGSPDRMVKV